MTIPIVKSARLWALHGLLLAGFVYSALALNVKPVYASSCTPAQCDEAWTDAIEFCGAEAAVRAFYCPFADGSVWEVQCWNGSDFVNSCSHFPNDPYRKS